jgi:sugar/nucleoside kinase (ribokinase family)
LPEWGQEVLGSDYVQVSSGQSAYSAFALRNYGIPTCIIGNVGDDIYGNKIIKDLSNSGVDISTVEQVKNGNTGITVAIVREDGERAFVSDPSSLDVFDRDLVQRHYKRMLSSDIICVVGIFFLPNFSIQDVKFVCENAQSSGKATLLDTGWDPDNWQTETIKELRGILKHVDFFIPNLDEARALTGYDTPEKAASAFLADGCKTVIIKLGEQGSYLSTGKKEILIPAHKVDVFDAVGAGDVFNAGFIYGTIQDWPLDARMIFGTATSALYISKSEDRFPELQDTIHLANKNEIYEFSER